jgi:hypothetical protein
MHMLLYETFKLKAKSIKLNCVVQRNSGVTSKILSVCQRRVHCHTAHLESIQGVSTDQEKFLSLVASDTINKMTNRDYTLRKKSVTIYAVIAHYVYSIPCKCDRSNDG